MRRRDDRETTTALIAVAIMLAILCAMAWADEQFQHLPASHPVIAGADGGPGGSGSGR